MAAGKGERLKGLTQTIPKALVQIAGKTLLEHAIERFAKANIQDITIAVGWKSDMITDIITQFENSPEVQIIEVSNYDIGPLQSLTVSLEAIRDEDAIICPVDLLVSSNSIEAIVSHHTVSQDTLVTLAVDSQSNTGSIVSVDSHGRALGIQKEVESANSIVKSAMFMVVSSGFLEYCKAALKSGSRTAVPVLNKIIEDDHSIKSYDIQEEWFDIDTLPDILEANRFLLESSQVNHHGAIFIPSGDTMEIGDLIRLESGIEVGIGVCLKGPCLISGKSKIGDNCTIGPYTSLGTGTQVGDYCEIQNAVVFGLSKIRNRSKVSDVIINDSERFSMEE
ncbi:NDP-sugar synthase [Candidatus Thorarchaeota archaeon]|nr:MAG: NDP-sugar synthase [Candidatus Thorarchaeota archaeon]